jgi:large subunit ribosomal protein L24
VSEEDAMSVSSVKKGDTVICTTGVSAGKTGKVLDVLKAKQRILVEGLSLVKKALRKTQDNPQGGISEKESPISMSNVMLYCPHCKKGVRASRARDGARSVRNCKLCGHAFDG